MVSRDIKLTDATNQRRLCFLAIIFKPEEPWLMLRDVIIEMARQLHNPRLSIT